MIDNSIACVIVPNFSCVTTVCMESLVESMDQLNIYFRIKWKGNDWVLLSQAAVKGHLAISNLNT